MKKKFVQDLPVVVEAEKAFITAIDAAEAAPECYNQLSRQLSDLAQARDGETDEEELRALSRSRLRAVETVREYGPSGDHALDSAFGRMEVAAEEAGEAKRSRR
jgi:hypothetical protein